MNCFVFFNFPTLLVKISLTPSHSQQPKSETLCFPVKTIVGQAKVCSSANSTPTMNNSSRTRSTKRTDSGGVVIHYRQTDFAKVRRKGRREDSIEVIYTGNKHHFIIPFCWLLLQIVQVMKSLDCRDPFHFVHTGKILILIEKLSRVLIQSSQL